MSPLFLLLSCAYTPPLDTAADPTLNALAGEVVVTGTRSVGPTFVLLFDAADPPPPAGTGSPLDFGAISASEYTGLVEDGQGGGVQSAPWALTGVPDGTFLVTALMDMDGDFQPLLTSNAGATCGDWLGAHLSDLSTGDVSPVSVSGGTLLDDVTIVVGNPVTTERPAFAVDAPVIDQTVETLQMFTLESVGVHSQILDLTGPFDGTDSCGTMFLEYAPDADGDGAPDPHPNPEYAAEGALDLWPKVYLQYYGPDAATPGGGLEAGESWAAEAIVYPLDVMTGAVPVGVPTPVTSLQLVWVPAAMHTLPDGTSEVVDAPNLPAGVWSITVVQITGQTWTVPNELAAFPATDGSFDPLSQAAGLGVQ